MNSDIKKNYTLAKITKKILWLFFLSFLIVCTASINKIFNIESLFSREWEVLYLVCLFIIFSLYMGLSFVIQTLFIDYKYEGWSAGERKKRYYILPQKRKIYYIFPILYTGISMYLIYYGFFIFHDIIEIIGVIFLSYGLLWGLMKFQDALKIEP